MIRPSAVLALVERLDRLPIYRETVLPLVRNTWVPVLLAGVLVLATVVRVYDIGDNPPGFFCDEASYGYNAYSVLKTGSDEHGESWPIFFRAFGDYKLPIYTYSLIPGIAVFGLTDLTVRITTAAFGIATVLAVYFLVGALFRQRALALTAAAVLAILPWHIHYSRTGLGEIVVFPLFLALSVYLFLLGTTRPRFWLASGLAFGLTFYSYRSAWVTVPPLLLVLAVLYHRELIKNWRFSSAGLLMVAVLSIPAAQQVLLNDRDRSRDQSLLTLGLGPLETVKTFLSHYRSNLATSFLFEGTAERNPRHYLPGFGGLYWWQAPFIILGLLGLVWRPSRPKLLMLALLLLYPLGAAMSRDSPSSSRAIIGTLPLAIITAYGIVTSVRLLTMWQRPRALKVVGFALAGLLMLGTSAWASARFASYVQAYHDTYPHVAADYWGWQWGARDIIGHFVSVEPDYDELFMEGAFNVAEIFLPFYAPNDCEKCMVGDWDKYDPWKKQLFALRPYSMWLTYDYDIKGTLRYPNGEVAFAFAEITGTRALLPGDLPQKISGDSKETLAALEKAVALNPSLAEAYLHRAGAYFNLGDLEAAIRDYDQAIRLDPNLALAYNDRGNARWKLGKFRLGIRDYDKAIELDPNLVLAQYNWGTAHATLGRNDKAKTGYHRAIALDPNNAAVRNNLGNTHRHLGEFEQAIAHYDTAIELDPVLAEAYAGRGYAYGQLGELARAIVDLDKAVELDPNLALAYSSRGIVYQNTGELDRAIADFDKAIELDPGYGEAYVNRGITYRQMGDLRRAAPDFDMAIELDRDYALAYANRGLVYLDQGNSEQAIAVLQKAIELDRVSDVDHQAPQNLYWRLGDFHEGAEKLKEALSSTNDPDSIAQLEDMIDYLVERG